jgi:hypothetical protein
MPLTLRFYKRGCGMCRVRQRGCTMGPIAEFLVGQLLVLGLLYGLHLLGERRVRGRT